MSAPSSFFSELRRRNVLRAGALYVGAAWALTQGIAQLGPAFGAPDWMTRWFAIAGAIGFPFWLAFAWFFELTPQGLKLDATCRPTRRSRTRPAASSISGSSACSPSPWCCC